MKHAEVNSFDLSGELVAVDLDGHSGPYIMVRCLVDEDVARRIAPLMFYGGSIHVMGSLPSESKAEP